MTIQLNLAPNSLANLIALCEKRPNLGLDYKILSGDGAFKEVEVTMPNVEQTTIFLLMIAKIPKK